MLKNIIDLLQVDDFINESYNIQIAKGLYSLPKGRKEIVAQIKRTIYLKQQK